MDIVTKIRLLICSVAFSVGILVASDIGLINNSLITLAAKCIIMFAIAYVCYMAFGIMPADGVGRNT